MSSQTLTLSGFLLARVSEDEAVARAAEGAPSDPRQQHRLWTARTELAEGQPVPMLASVGAAPARILAECEAKRRIVELHPLTTDVVPVDSGPSPGCGCETCHTVTASSVFDTDYVEALGPCDTLLVLAAVYAHHPDYRDEWRP